MKTVEQTQKAEELVKAAQDYVDLSKVARKVRTPYVKTNVQNTLADLTIDINKLTEGL